MFIHKGQALGSIQVDADPQAAPKPKSAKKTESKAAPEPEPAESVQAEPEAQPEPEPESEPESRSEASDESPDEAEEADQPKPYAPKGDWVDYAVAQGLDPDEADKLTKNDLIERYGG